MTSEERIEMMENEIKFMKIYIANLEQIVQRLQAPVWPDPRVAVEPEIHKIKIPGGFSEVRQ